MNVPQGKKGGKKGGNNQRGTSGERERSGSGSEGSLASSFTAPTPNNTPKTNAPINYHTLSNANPKKSKAGDSLAADVEARLSGMAISQTEEQEFPPAIQRRINALLNIQDKHSALSAEFREELLALEAKYEGLYRPLYDQRAAVVSGKKEPTAEECAREDEDVDEAEPAGKGPKGIPAFWLNALKNHPYVNEIIFEHDYDALTYLNDIRISYAKDNHSFTLEFHFNSNPYFTNEVLNKTYHIENRVGAEYDDVMYSHAEGCDIDWKQGKNLTVRIESKKQKNKAQKKVRIVKKEVPQDSFFGFFTPPQLPEEEEKEEEEEEEDEYSPEGEKIEQDFEVGEIIKSKIVPDAVDWFTGKALEFDQAFMDDEYGDDEDSMGEEDDMGSQEEEDDDDDDDAAAPNTSEKPAECAQQ